MTATAIENWEAAWASYVDALEADDHWQDWAGCDDFIRQVARLAENLREAKRRLRTIDPEFCTKLGI